MAIYFGKCKVEISNNGTSWTDISGNVNSVEVSGGDRKIAEVFALGADYPVLVAGPRESLTIKVRVIYNESTSGAWETLRGYYENGSTVYLRFTPRGAGSGNFIFTSDPGYIKSFTYPGGEAGSDDVVACEIEVVTARLTKSVSA